jgi:hypothetical protein
MIISFEPRFQPGFPNVKVELYYRNEVIVDAVQFGVQLDYKLTNMSKTEMERITKLLVRDTDKTELECLQALYATEFNYPRAYRFLKP